MTDPLEIPEPPVSNPDPSDDLIPLSQQIVEHMLESLRDSNEMPSSLIDSISKLAKEGNLQNANKLHDLIAMFEPPPNEDS